MFLILFSTVLPSLNIYTFIKGCKEAKKKEVDGNDISEYVFFADNEDSDDSDPGRTECEADIS